MAEQFTRGQHVFLDQTRVEFVRALGDGTAIVTLGAAGGSTVVSQAALRAEAEAVSEE